MEKSNHSGLIAATSFQLFERRTYRSKPILRPEVTVLSAFLASVTRVTTFSINSPYRKNIMKVTRKLVTSVRRWAWCRGGQVMRLDSNGGDLERGFPSETIVGVKKVMGTLGMCEMKGMCE